MSKNYYLVNISVVETKYEADESTTFSELRLVRADSAKAAQLAAERYWEKLTDEYVVYYRASATVRETIEQEPLTQLADGA
jgi:hypothetical protein